MNLDQDRSGYFNKGEMLTLTFTSSGCDISFELNDFGREELEKFLQEVRS